jgi:hypothetical protein
MMSASELRIGDRIRLAVADSLEVVKSPILAIWSLYLVLTPLYVFAPGLPQPGDLLAVLLAPLVIVPFGRRLFPRAVVSLRALARVVVYIVVANLVWSIALDVWEVNMRRGLWMSPIYYIYNMAIFWAALALYHRHREAFLRLTYRVLYVATIAFALAAPILGSSHVRQKLLFNNPNQLGFHATLVATVLVISQRPLRISTLQTSIGLLACSYLAILSASKAALGSMAILIGVGVFNRARTVVITAIIAGVALIVSASAIEAVDRAHTRIVRDSSHSFLEERGYDRILNNPEYLVLGSGEGAYVRFRDSTKIGSAELHSSLGTMLFCYGFVGLGLFAWFVWASLRGVGLRIWLCLAAPFAYGFTHQALRTTLFWVLIALAMSYYHLEHERSRLPVDAPRS